MQELGTARRFIYTLRSRSQEPPIAGCRKAGARTILATSIYWPLKTDRLGKLNSHTRSSEVSNVDDI
eukprot:6180396-Pleurochrysis_carterae.AAC.1